MHMTFPYRSAVLHLPALNLHDLGDVVVTVPVFGLGMSLRGPSCDQLTCAMRSGGDRTS
jgi:hypothetical protein